MSENQITNAELEEREAALKSELKAIRAKLRGSGLSTKEKLKHCAGCHDNFYNCASNSGSSTGLCWSLPTMKLVLRKEVHIDQRPPWTQHPTLTPTCYHRQGYVYVGADQTH